MGSDTVQIEIHIPEVKLVCTKELVASWGGRKSCWVREFQSLVGSLQHACKVVHPGHTCIHVYVGCMSCQAGLKRG